MKIRPLLLTIGSLTISGLHAVEKPNIVFILADDLGYAEVGCYGQKKKSKPRTLIS